MPESQTYWRSLPGLEARKVGLPEDRDDSWWMTER